MDKRTQIQAGAQTLFARFGLKKVTMDEIARESRVSKATVYKYYANKGRVFDEVVRHEAASLLENMKKAVAAEQTVAGKFRAHLMTKLHRLRELVSFYQVAEGTANDYWPYIEAIRKDFVKAEQRILSTILRGGMASGELDVKDVNLMAKMMLISLRAQEYEWATRGVEANLEHYVDMLVDVMLNGIRKR